MRYGIIFPTWNDYVKGLSAAANNDVVLCKPKQVLFVTKNQLEALEKNDIHYEMLKA